MIHHQDISSPEVQRLIHHQKVVWAGNRKLKIYGHLRCISGKRMKREHRVFFGSQEEAGLNGYRPCGHCLRSEYQKYKKALL